MNVPIKITIKLRDYEIGILLTQPINLDQSAKNCLGFNQPHTHNKTITTRKKKTKREPHQRPTVTIKSNNAQQTHNQPLGCVCVFVDLSTNCREVFICLCQ